MEIMVCSKCGTIISKAENEHDIHDCSWRCPNCDELWFSSDGWELVGNVLLPHR